MGKKQEPWDTVADYIAEMAHMAADAVRDQGDRFGMAWKGAAEGTFGYRQQVQHMQESTAAGLRYAGKAFVKTRDLMIALAGDEKRDEGG